MKIKILNSKCVKGDCGIDCPFCKITKIHSEAFSRMAGDYQPEEGVLQEAPENIIPPAFKRILYYAKMGQRPPTEVMLQHHVERSAHAHALRDYGRVGFDWTGPESEELVANAVDEKQMETKAAQDTMAQLLVRYISRPRSGGAGAEDIHFAFNPMSLTMQFNRAFQLVGTNPWRAIAQRAEEEGKIDDWKKAFEDYEKLKMAFTPGSETAESWLTKGRQMAADGAGHQENMIFLGKQYKSHMKMIAKFFKKNPIYAELKDDVDEYIRRRWNRWQDELIVHAHQNFRKVGKFLRNNPQSYKEIDALIKKYPSKKEFDDISGAVVQEDSLTMINDHIDNELLKRQLDPCPDGWGNAFKKNPTHSDFEGNETPESAPCVLHKYDDGFIWWDRKASRCEIAGEEMANCGAANMEDSTLIILKEFVKNDSYNNLDKLKGRIMIEFNASDHEFVQILGFGNTFPDVKFWAKIKDLWENLDKPKVDRTAFMHLRDRGLVDNETIKKFLASMADEKYMEPPESFFPDFVERMRKREYNQEYEMDYGGRQILRFLSEHRDRRTGEPNKMYAPIVVECAGRPLYYPIAPDSHPDDRHPSVEKDIYEFHKQNGPGEQMKEAVTNFLKHSIRRGFAGIQPQAGTFNDALERTLNSIRFIRFDSSTTSKGVKMKMRLRFNIVPEFFTDESSFEGDEPLARPAHDVIMGMRRVLGDGGIIRLIDGALMLENSRVNPEEYTEMIPGVDDVDDPEGDVDEIGPELYGYRDHPEIMRWMGTGGERRRGPATASRWLGRLLNDFQQGGHSAISDLQMAAVNAITHMHDIDFLLTPDEIELYAELMDIPVTNLDAAQRGQQTDDGPDEEERNWRPGMPTPGSDDEGVDDVTWADLTQGDPSAVADHEEGWPAGDEYIQRLIRQGNLLARSAMTSPQRLQRQGWINIFNRWKEEFEETGMYDDWKSALPDDHPLKQSELLEDQIMVEARHIVNKLFYKKQTNGIKLRITEGEVIDFQTGREVTVDEHFLDFLEEKIPSLDTENPAEVQAVIRAIEENDTAEKVFKALEQQGLVTRHIDSAYETTMWQIQQIKTIMTSHWFTRMEPLNEWVSGDYISYEDAMSRVQLYINAKWMWPEPGDMNNPLYKQWDSLEKSLMWPWWRKKQDTTVEEEIAKMWKLVDTASIPDQIKTEKAKEEIEAILAALFNKNEPMTLRIDEKKNRQGVGILPYRMIDGEIEFLIGEVTNIYHAMPDEEPESDFKSKWTFFKGKIDDGEDEKTAARREFEEESTFSWDGPLDDAMMIENRNVKIWLIDNADLEPSNFNREAVSKITGEYLYGEPEIWSIGWFSPEEAESKLSNNQKDLISQAMAKLTESTDAPEEPRETGAPMTPYLNENAGVENLHIFDFDDTIAFTKSYTVITHPDGKVQKVDQHGLDKVLQKGGGEENLRRMGFKLDFSDFKTVKKDSPLNPTIASRINDCCLAGGKDPAGDFYVLTARAAAAEDSIHQYLAANGIEIERQKVIGVEGKSKGDKIKFLIQRMDGVKRVIFYDDSDSNIEDVRRLREDPELEGITFELYPVDKQGNIPQEPLQETTYRRKTFKLKIGGK